MDHQKTDDRAKEQVAAEDARRGDGDDNRQVCECGVCNSIKECEPVAAAEAQTRDLRESFDKTHHLTGSDDGGKDRDEDVTDGLESLPPDRSLRSRGSLDVILRAGRNAGDLDELVENLVDRAGADDQLELSVRLEHALDAVNFLERGLVDLAVIRDNKTKSGRAVRGGYYVRAAADIIGNLLSTFVIIQSHYSFLPLSGPLSCP